MIKITKRPSVLVDARNIKALMPALMAEFGVENQLNGFDLETEDSRRHAGLNRAMAVDSEGHKSAAKKLLFDVKRTTITGFSMASDKGASAYYFNMAHADVENRLTFEQVRPLLDLAKERGMWVAHKAPFELCMTENCWGWGLGPKVICTLQLAVTCFNDDTYPLEKFLEPGLGDGFKVLLPGINKHFAYYEPGTDLTAEQEDLLFKFIAKESDSAHSYNGYIKSIKYGYGLKPLCKYFLGYEQATFAETLGDKAHMGQLTGEEVCSYGADDAWVCLELYHVLLEFLITHNPKAVQTFFDQENPMVHHYAAVWSHGVRINAEKVLAAKLGQRKLVAGLLRNMKKRVASLLPFPDEAHEKLVKYDKAWAKSGEKYRNDIRSWCSLPEETDDFRELMQTKTALSKQWAEEMGRPESKGISITYYQVLRGILYDLCGCSFQLADGKVASDAEAQRIMAERWAKKHEFEIDERTYRPKLKDGQLIEEKVLAVANIIADYKQLSSANQVIKLFVNKYLNLQDPDTGRVHPILSSQLNSHRMALEEPNTSQLPKFGETNFVREFFEADDDESVIVSGDWSAVELVLIGELSGDPVMAKAYSTLPHGDLHTETASALLDISITDFKAKPDAKQVRNELGKPANFGYWYSGALGTTAKDLGWSSEQMWEFVDKFRSKFSVGESWRVGTIAQARIDGYVDLPDGHRRYRYESTGAWANQMQHKFNEYGHGAAVFGQLAIKKIANRSGNQAVNSLIQGSCATLAKRSILLIDAAIQKRGLRARFMFPVHDELVYSVHRDDAVQFTRLMASCMMDHPGVIKKLKLDVAIAVGRNYLAWNKDTNRRGQIELDEASPVPCLPEARWKQKLTDEERQKCVDYLFEA